MRVDGSILFWSGRLGTIVRLGFGRAIDKVKLIWLIAILDCI